MSTWLLKRLSRLAEQESPPSRSEVVERFCHLTGWVDAKGRPCTGTASVGLARLQKQGHIKLPPPAATAERKRRRSLRDDGQPLPLLPKLPARAEDIKGLRVHLIEGSTDAKHPIWNRIICREHPQGDRPLCGMQLRYLIECDRGLIGAFGFAAPAFHLACRDQWIGWSSEARHRNRPLVVGLSRFLIRPGLRCSNLASLLYGMILKQLPSDWEARYGFRPVLVETYVDQNSHYGRSLSASNWQRLGQSEGRGRDDPDRQKPNSIKDLWVYELIPAARAILQSQPLEPIVPRSVFSPDAGGGWVEAEMDGLAVGHEKLAQRARRMLADRWAHPQASFYASFGTKAGGKAAYRWVENKHQPLNFQSLLTPHYKQTARRMAAEKVVLLPQDTTTLSYNRLQQTKGLGPTGENRGRGMFLHSLLAFRTDGISLGVAFSEVWARPEESDTAQRNQQSIDEKESGRWIRAFQLAGERARQMPQTQLVVCGDRESDIFELYDQAQPAPKNLFVLARAQHDRVLTNGEKLWPSLQKQPVEGTFEVFVPRRKDQPARTARLEIRWMAISIQAPAVGRKKSWPSLELYAVSAQEVQAPKGVEPIEWVVLSNWPVKNFKTALRLVRWYALRWGIECWHRVLKTGCGVEKRQFRSAQALTRALALDMIVAMRVLLMVRLGKDHPDLPASVIYTPEEIEMLESLKKKAPELCPAHGLPKADAEKNATASVTEPAEAKPASQSSESTLAIHSKAQPTLTVLEANLILARLAGSWCRRGDKHPGEKTLAEGLKLLHTLMWYEQLNQKPPPSSSSPHNRDRRAPT